MKIKLAKDAKYFEDEVNDITLFTDMPEIEVPDTIINSPDIRQGLMTGNIVISQGTITFPYRESKVLFTDDEDITPDGEYIYYQNGEFYSRNIRKQENSLLKANDFLYEQFNIDKITEVTKNDKIE